MKITLMCKDIPVCSFNIDTVSGWIQDKIATINVEYLPLSVQYSHDSTSALKNWIDNRSVSVNRKDLAAISQQIWILQRRKSSGVMVQDGTSKSTSKPVNST